MRDESISMKSESEQAIFAEALRCTPGDRAAYLHEACGTDRALRQRVEALLRVSENLGDFLESPPTGLTGSADSTFPPESGGEKPGDRIGRYKLLEKIGEGGCGTVYMADQEEPVRRRVALKIIKLGMDTRSVVARFEGERQALALMDHPNIAKVLDGGATETGRPYFVMELVRGVRITEFCLEAKLPIEDRLRLFAQVCQAIQHAHQKGLIHRDIKPSNVLVTINDGAPVPKVIDFGIAKATGQRLTEKTLFTQFHSFIGTPAYISPEQAEMSSVDVDTRSDIYSLGVLLYELLTGETPFDGEELLRSGLDELRRTIREDEPLRPSTRILQISAKNVRNARSPSALRIPHLAIQGDLDCIIMKCLEKDRARRYETAADLAQDIERHLKDEPVTAQIPSFTYRTGKFISKHRLAVSSTAAILVTLLAGLAVSTTLYFQEKSAWASEKVQRANAEKSERAARIEAAKNATTAGFMAEMLAGIHPDSAKGRDVTLLSEILEGAADRVGAEMQDQPEVEANLRRTIGETYLALGLYARAEPHLNRARELRLHLVGPEDPETLEIVNLSANLLAAQGKYDPAETLLSQSLGILKRRLGAEDPKTLSAIFDLANVYTRQGRTTEAENLHRPVLDIRKRVLGPEHRQTLSSMQALATVLWRQNKSDEAISLLRETLETSRRVTGPEHVFTLGIMNDLGSALYRIDRNEEAESLLLQDLEISRRVLRPDHPHVLLAMNSLASVYRTQGKLAEAATLHREDLELSQRTLGREHPHTLIAMANLSKTYEGLDRHAEAELLSRQGLEISARVLGPAHPNTLYILQTLAESISRAPGKESEHAALQKQLADGRSQSLASTDANTMVARENLYRAHRRDRNFEAAEILSARTLQETREELGSEHPITLSWINNLASSYADQGKHVEAEGLLREAVATGRRSLETNHIERLRSLRGLADQLTSTGRWPEALPLLVERSLFEPDDTISTLALAAYQVWFAQFPEHAATCARFLRYAEGTTQAFTADRAAKAILLRSTSGTAEVQKALILARRAVELGQEDSLLPYYQLTLGIAEFRLGHRVAAEQLFLKGIRANGLYAVQGPARLFHAMSLCREGRIDEAKKLVAAAKEQMRPLPVDDLHPFQNGGHHDDIFFWLTYKEARALLQTAEGRNH